MKTFQFASVIAAVAVSLVSVAAQQARPVETHPPNPDEIVRIEVLAEEEGRTTVVIVANTAFQPFGYRHYRIEGEEPRVVIRIRGIEKSREAATVEIGDGNVVRIRTGLHPDHAPPEFHAVFDLASPDVILSMIRHDGNRLQVGFRSATPGALRSPSPLSTESVRPTERVPLSATPAAPPLPTATPSPPPGSVHEASAPDQNPEVTGNATAVDSKPPQPVTIAPNEQFLAITEISRSRWTDGSTLLRFSANREIPPSAIQHFRLFGEPPRYVLAIRNARAPDLPGVIQFSDPNIRRVRLIRRTADAGGEVQFVLELAASEVVIDEVAHQGAHIAMRIMKSPIE